MMLSVDHGAFQFSYGSESVIANSKAATHSEFAVFWERILPSALCAGLPAIATPDLQVVASK
jgi:hypothetical protein